MLATESFFKRAKLAEEILSRKDRKGRKEIEGGNGTTVKISRKVREVRKVLKIFWRKKRNYAPAFHLYINS
ncbi:MAG: hypothetical protein IKX40_10585 [Thermoguttaceae bacterium]|nr:hypothetical protein [Thermoguttaceae bacterium]